MDIKRSSALAKGKILSHGFRLNPNALFGLGTLYKEEHRGYDDSNWGVDKDMPVPSELMLPGGMVVGTHIRPDSPLEVRMEGRNLYLFENDRPISRVFYLPRPKMWGAKLRDGTPVKAVVNFYGLETLNVNIYSGCEFWDAKLPCGFCSVAPTQAKYGEAVVKKTPDQIREAVSLAFSLGDRIEFVLTTGGSTIDPNVEFDNHVAALKMIGEFTPWGKKIRGNTALMPPMDLEKLRLLRETGMEHPSFNLEVWGKERFTGICPGKMAYRGYDHIMEAYSVGVKRFFGRGALWCNFVAGINKIDELKEGFSAMADMGVVPGANVFHPDVGAVLGRKMKSPPLEYIIELYRHAARLYHKHGYKPFFNETSLRNSLANEAYQGWI